MKLNLYDGSAAWPGEFESATTGWRAVKRRFHMFTPFAANVGDEGER